MPRRRNDVHARYVAVSRYRSRKRPFAAADVEHGLARSDEAARDRVAGSLRFFERIVDVVFFELRKASRGTYGRSIAPNRASDIACVSQSVYVTDFLSVESRDRHFF